MFNYIKDPRAIEETSFEIITEELGEKNNKLTELTAPIVKRVIHTTADFEYADLIEFHEDAIIKGVQALKNGKNIYTDTSMIISGVNKIKLKSLGCNLYNFVHDEDVKKEAIERGITRSMVGIEKAMKDDSISIYAIGNAPTAVFKIKELLDKGYKRPDLIIGVPVGFVGAAESKEVVKELGIPYITVNGRKGGSTVAVAIINALLKMI